MTDLRRLLVIAAAIVITGAGLADAAEDARPMTPRDVARLERMTAAVISPDGAAIAAVRSIPRDLFEEDDGPEWAELYVIDRTDGTARPFVTGEVRVSGVDWRPDGSAISFIAEREGDDDPALYLIPVDGGEDRPVVAIDTSVTGYAWSPDGARVAIIASRPETELDEELAGHGFTQEVFEEDWRPLEVWIAELDGDSEPRLVDLDGSAFQVRFSPDGERLAVALAPSPLVDHRLMFQNVHVVSVETGEVVATMQREGKLDSFEWSPDGSRLAMISAADWHDPSASSLLVASVAQEGLIRPLRPREP